MNTITQQVIEFLTHPELPFGAEEDLLILQDPESLQQRVAFLLEEYPGVLGAGETAELKSHLGEAAWSFIAMEFQARIEATSGFFDADAKNSSA